MRKDSDFEFSVAYSAVAHAVVIALLVYLVFLKPDKEEMPLVMAPAASAPSIDWQDTADFLPGSVQELPEALEAMLDSPVPRELPTLNSSRPADDPESRIALPLPPPDPVTKPEPVLEEAIEAPKPPVEKKVEVPKPPVKKKVEVPKPPVKKKVEVPKPPVKKKVEAPKPPVKKKVEAPKPPVKKKIEAPKPVVKKKVKAPKLVVKRKIEAPKPVVKKKKKKKKVEAPKPVAKKKVETRKPVAKKKVEPPKPAKRKVEPVSVAKKPTSVVAPKAKSLGSSRANTAAAAPRGQRVGGGSGSNPGADYGWYDQLIKRTFEQNWREPQLTTGQNLYVKVKITVSPDGRVIEARFVKQSGVRVMDDSVVAALSATRRMPKPLPGDLAAGNYSFLFTFRLTPTPNAR